MNQVLVSTEEYRTLVIRAYYWERLASTLKASTRRNRSDAIAALLADATTNAEVSRDHLLSVRADFGSMSDAERRGIFRAKDDAIVRASKDAARAIKSDNPLSVINIPA